MYVGVLCQAMIKVCKICIYIAPAECIREGILAYVNDPADVVLQSTPSRESIKHTRYENIFKIGLAISEF